MDYIATLFRTRRLKLKKVEKYSKSTVCISI